MRNTKSYTREGLPIPPREAAFAYAMELAKLRAKKKALS
jgi:hypothetical protein